MCCRSRWKGSTSSSSGAGRPTSRPGSRGAARGRSASTSPRPSSRRHGRCRRASGSSFRCSRRARRRCRFRTRASTSPSPSTGRPSGPIRTPGFPRPRGCCDPAASSSSSSTARSSILTSPDEEERHPDASSCDRTSACTGSSGRTRALGRLPPRLRRLDPAAAAVGLRGSRPRRAAGARRSGPEHRYPELPDRAWARQWPSEEIWRARKT